MAYPCFGMFLKACGRLGIRPGDPPRIRLTTVFGAAGMEIKQETRTTTADNFMNRLPQLNSTMLHPMSHNPGFHVRIIFKRRQVFSNEKCLCPVFTSGGATPSVLSVLETGLLEKTGRTESAPPNGVPSPKIAAGGLFGRISGRFKPIFPF
jgi:hypothetical protein